MNGSSCCDKHTSECVKIDTEPVERFRYHAGFLKRCLYFLRWIFTGSVIILLPKCPFCLAAYIAMVTGIGLSYPIASFIRILLIILSMVSLSSFAARRIYLYYNKEQLHLSLGNHQYKINLLALQLVLISSLYYLIIGV